MAIWMGYGTISDLRRDATVPDRIAYAQNDFAYWNWRTDDKNYVLARDGSQVIGVLKWGWYGFGDQYLAIAYVSVDPRYQRQGIARKMIHLLGKRLKKIGATQIRASFLTEEGWKVRIDLVFEEVLATYGVRHIRDYQDEQRVQLLAQAV